MKEFPITAQNVFYLMKAITIIVQSLIDYLGPWLNKIILTSFRNRSELRTNRGWRLASGLHEYD